ncbi:hypothetical protein F5B22DRAFT_588756 [Xylaria bambusicola]|uniref:uncharacterized protein n=1 Tax=Xylaria bambusicola TaxID=326684 RepID=UPI002008B7C4|nr:uncharacterized protein F5B22DRAFT_588756 [Xylaria bambusicola]KAI0526012.1 hypothetical protein F5B22DRAFT_588756 [Xylaria bambusicola]
MSTATSPSQQEPPFMAATTHHQHHPSLSALSETSSASTHVSYSAFPFYADQPPPLSTPPASSVSGSRNTKGLVLNNGRIPASPVQSIRRKPLSATASPIATRYSSGEHLASVVKSLPRPEQRYDRSFSVDSPTVYEFPHAQVQPMSRSPRWESTTKLTSGARDIALLEIATEKSPENQLPSVSTSGNTDSAAIAAGAKRQGSADSHAAALQTAPSHTEDQTLYDDLLADEDEDPLSDNILDGYNSDSSRTTNTTPNHNMSLHISRKPIPQQLTLKSDEASLIRTNSNELKTPNTDKPLPKSPNSRLVTFFGWASSPTTEASEKAYSPLPSPFNFSRSGSQPDASPITTLGPHSSFDASKVQADSPDSREYCESYLVTPSAVSPDSTQIDEMEDELKAISAELAASIRREIDLEDLVDRLQAEKDNPTVTGNKRTSDYFSDSGYSSAKFSEYDQSREEIEKIQRRSEQEKAQLRLELTTKLQDERLKRQKMDEQIRDLSSKASQIDLDAVNGTDAGDRVKELEATCENLRRKLSEERQAKDNIEDMFSALKGELRDAADERDNLRDEIVPQLRARVEGLESQASELEKMTYESTKMQQELNNLRSENSNLKQVQMESISEEGGTTSAPLSRSNSVGGSRASFKLQRPPSGIFRSKTVKSTESRDQLSERLKDVEEQRDALHRALKNLLERQEHQNRENQKKIRVLEMERDRLLTSSPQKAGFQRDIGKLRAEITVLRRRAEEALDQKWQVEKGLAGLKMDLDKAEQEVAYLRKLLEEKDILIPPTFARLSSGSDQFATPVTSESLLAAYHDLQKTHAESLERVKSLEMGAMGDEKTLAAMQKLEKALSVAVSERDLAQHEVTSYKERLASLKAEELAHLTSEKALANELQESARRVEELAIQVQQQLSTNQQLRSRIADTIARGDADQKANAERITTMQAHLRSLEEKLEAAQAASEDRVAHHEEEISNLKESHNVQLTRLRDGLRSPRIFPDKSPLSPLFSAPGALSPRLSITRSGPAMNVSEETQIDNLKARVAELENALMDADVEMQQVVGRMNTAQIEVLQLQEEREAAINQTRKLERELKTEKIKSFEERFKSLQS